MTAGASLDELEQSARRVLREAGVSVPRRLTGGVRGDLRRATANPRHAATYFAARALESAILARDARAAGDAETTSSDHGSRMPSRDEKGACRRTGKPGKPCYFGGFRG